eukprot:c11539_g1_i1 orf=2-508(-)
MSWEACWVILFSPLVVPCCFSSLLMKIMSCACVLLSMLAPLVSSLPLSNLMSSSTFSSPAASTCLTASLALETHYCIHGVNGPFGMTPYTLCTVPAPQHLGKQGNSEDVGSCLIISKDVKSSELQIIDTKLGILVLSVPKMLKVHRQFLLNFDLILCLILDSSYTRSF